VTVWKYVILEDMPLESRMSLSTEVRGMGRIVVVLQIVLCGGITTLSGNPTPVAQSTARNISDSPKRKRTLKLPIDLLILMLTFCTHD